MNMMMRIIEMVTTTAVAITPATAGPADDDDDEPSLAIGEAERDINDHSTFSSSYP